jgi:tRNA dimethylallyltransferase
MAPVELISVDAIAVYRGFDIGSAKPDRASLERLAYHLVDVAEPEEEFSVHRFVDLARRAVAEIEARKALPVLVGGSGLYHRAIVDDLQLPGRYEEIARELEAEAALPGGLERLFARLGELDPLARARIEPGNARRIIRALEVTLGTGAPFSSSGPGLTAYPASQTAQIGLLLTGEELARRIDERLSAQMAAGFLEEVRELSTRPLSRTAAQALGYRELLAHVRGECSLPEALEEIRRRSRRFARRQLAWFRRDPRIAWFDATREDLLAEVLGHLLSEGGLAGGAA